MMRIDVGLGAGSYSVEIGEGIIKKTDFSRFGRKSAVITDYNVKKLYGNDLHRCMIKQGLDVELFTLEAGEKSKTPETAARLGRELAKNGYDRDSFVVSLGGGVVGDIAGYVASFYERGIGYVHVPTTLLAQVDSSIGGKTGVNIPEGKNMFGSIYQPLAVITDIETLQTLSESEIKNGIAEVIKYGMVDDKKLFGYLESNCRKRDIGFYFNIVEKSCRIKARIVEKDEKETELRKILNYGHTVGHAIEASGEYEVSHGKAVGIGMACEARISNYLGILKYDDVSRQNELIEYAGLPTYNEYFSGAFIDKLIDIMKADKKNKNREIHFVLPEEIGKVKKENNQVAFPVDEVFIRECLK